MFNPPYEENNKGTLTLGNEPKNSKGLEKYLAKLLTNFSWYFDFKTIRHFTCNNDLLVSLNKSPHQNTITITFMKRKLS
jgi:hypothetical protein